MNDGSFDWQVFLERWRAEWMPRADEEEEEAQGASEGDEEGQDEGDRDRGVLGRPGATPAALAAAEERLGRRLPPSYRAFLAASDGWRVDQTAGVYRLGGVAEVDWFRDPFDLTPLYEEGLREDSAPEEVRLAGMWRRALRLETDSDMTHALLDPGDTDPDGEWALYVHKGWSGGSPDRYPSFRAYMEAMYRSFHADRVDRPEFVNATTRAQDARVEEARRLALAGRHGEALPLLEEAAAFGRPGSLVLLGQLRQFAQPAGRGRVWYGDLVSDARYRSEVLPVEAVEPAAGTGHMGGDDHWLRMMAARGVARESAEAVLRALRVGSHRYDPPGEWGTAVAEARSRAGWGETDPAWRVLTAGLASWEAPGPGLIAPVGLLADPVLGPLVTPERGRELLSIPRSGETGPPPEPLPGLDPPGLLWLTSTAGSRSPEGGYRCVWVEGADPAVLPELIGAEGAALTPPTGRFGSWRVFRRPPREEVPVWEDRALVAVGRTAGGWAFAFDGDGARLDDRFVSPAPAASTAGRAVVVWREPRHGFADGTPPAFHLSVAEGGREVFAFTVRAGETVRSGEIPTGLDPERLFRPQDTERENERRALRALHTELGLDLPRFALTQGSLRTFTTRSWTRPPHEGERYASLTFVRTRPGSPPSE
ncbi:SMI1/KNR4 family protein [Streptomyces sp. NPDC097619]|uniref:SMI1/KNR4 family protein n=1 Tax=Streptomyces sp. NPDC097619 TaxID=3157228 RepID=UPI00331C608A